MKEIHREGLENAKTGPGCMPPAQSRSLPHVNCSAKKLSLVLARQTPKQNHTLSSGRVGISTAFFSLQNWGVLLVCFICLFFIFILFFLVCSICKVSNQCLKKASLSQSRSGVLVFHFYNKITYHQFPTHINTRHTWDMLVGM